MGRGSGMVVAGVVSLLFACAACNPDEAPKCHTVTTFVNDPANAQQPMKLTYTQCDDDSPAPGDSKPPAGSYCDGLAPSFGGLELASDSSTLVDMFVADTGVIVVDTERVDLVDRNGKVLDTVAFDDGFGAHTADFDGALLVVTGATSFITFDPTLRELESGTLPAQCTGSVLLDSHTFLCGGGETSNRTYYAQNALTGDLYATTKDKGFLAGRMRRAPGRADFVAYEAGANPPNFAVFDVDGHGVVSLNASSASGLRASAVYAFADNPATHLVNDQGRLVCLTASDCGDPPKGLEPDGDIGLLPADTYFAAMDVDAAGKLHAIEGVQTFTGASGPTCETGCTIERIDVATGTVEASAPMKLAEPSGSIALRADPQGGFVLACGQYGSSGYRILLLPNAP
ncbi:MAG TPA: hypothetical protein VMI54_19280 [Polyangiaceae bacterium]|nr:hypothetical protein [Polyangiaceae bacterium]